MLTANPGAYR